MDRNETSRNAAGDALGLTGQPAPPQPPPGLFPYAWDAGDRRLICRDAAGELRSWYGGPDYLPPAGLTAWVCLH